MYNENYKINSKHMIVLSQALLIVFFFFWQESRALAIPDQVILILEINMIWSYVSVPAKVELFLVYPSS